MDQISQLASELGLLLKALNAQVTTAESCTGGGIAEAITRIAGSSAWFEAGFVTYSNQQKTRQLEVPEPLFTRVGAVSREVVEAMVQGAQGQSGARFAVAVSGVAGPGAVRPRSRSAPCGWRGAPATRYPASAGTLRATAMRCAGKP